MIEGGPATDGEQPGRAYRAAWAALLAGDRAAVARHFAAVRDRPDAWPVGCLVLDADPAEAARGQVAWALRAGTPAYAAIIAARVALARGERPAAEPPWEPGRGCLEEDLEALRTVLALRAARPGGLRAAMDLPLFQRLPRVERLVWAALAERARAGLAEAAALGYDRAALLLAVHDLAEGRIEAAAQGIERFAWRTDPKLELLRSWIEARGGRVARLEPLVADGDLRARYILGTSLLLGAPRRAAEEFDAVAGTAADPGDAEVLACAAELIATGSPGRRSPAALLPAARDHPWATWVLGLATLATDPAGADPGLCRRLVTLAAPGHEAAATALAAALTRARRGGELATLLGDLAERTKVAAVARLHGIAEAAAGRDGLEEAARQGTGSRAGPLPYGDAADARRSRGRPDVRDAATALAVARATAGEDRDGALRALRAPGSPVCDAVADAIEGRRVRLPDLPTRTAAVLRIVAADGDEELIEALRDEALDPADLARVVDLPRVLPNLCARGRKAPPTALTGLVRRLAAAYVPDPLTLARCATAIRDYETADRLWPLARSKAAAEYTAYLCHRAATLLPSDRLRAAGLMSRAAYGQLGELAEAIETEVCVERLLAHLFPGEPVADRPGRHRVLEEVVQATEPLRRALLDGDHDAITRAWSARLRDHDTRLHHALAVLYRERAQDGGVAATVLWALLVAREDFPDGPAAETVIKELLAAHVAQGRRALAAGDAATARRHLRCLHACRARAAAVTELAGELRLPRPRVRDEGLAAVAAIAGEAIDRWCADVVRDATERVEDPKVIAALPDNITGAYAAGIGRLRPFTGLGVPVPRVLRVGLEWHSDWCYGLYTRKETNEVRKVLVSARRFADALVPLCEKGAGHRPENRALCRYLLFRGYAAVDRERAVRYYEESLAWNPASERAVELLVEAYARRGRELSARSEFTAARELAEKARDLAPGDEEVAALLAELDGRSDQDTPASPRSGDAFQATVRLRQAEEAAARRDFATADADFAKAHEMSTDAAGRDRVARRWATVHLNRAVTLVTGAAGTPHLDAVLREGRRLLELAVTLDPGSESAAAGMFRTITRMEGRR